MRKLTSVSIQKITLLIILAAFVRAPDQYTPPSREHVFLVQAGPNAAYLPLISKPSLALSVYPNDRQASLEFYKNIYLASVGIDSAWSGNHSSCDAGETSPAFREAVRLRINYFRAMAGVPGDILLSDEYNRKAQQSALMMSVNQALSHDPPTNWLCYTAEGHEAAGSSNLALGIYGPNAIDAYVEDGGSGNSAAGHRRWVLYPQTKTMGSGDIPPTNGYPSANDLWVFDANIWRPRPVTREEYVAWPPPGYVPYQVVYPRWSFAYAGADFSAASVSMTSGPDHIAVTLQPVVNGYGENTLVWEPGLEFGIAPSSDVSYTVTVSSVKISGQSKSFTYNVVIINPDSQNKPLSDENRSFYLGSPPGGN